VRGRVFEDGVLINHAGDDVDLAPVDRIIETAARNIGKRVES
jgi:hypothetical protein